MNELHDTARILIERLGMVGTIARGIVFAIAGLLVVDASATASASDAASVDAARRAAEEPGRWDSTAHERDPQHLHKIRDRHRDREPGCAPVSGSRSRPGSGC
jgi:hypothetical protein